MTGVLVENGKAGRAILESDNHGVKFPAVQGQRMLADLHALRQFGANGNGVARAACSEPDVASRKWLAGRMSDAGLTPAFDPYGTLFGLPPGPGPHILLGSHTDTQPLGGWLDGAYGVIAGLEVARTAVEHGGPSVAVVSFQDEEGRFGRLTGSTVWTGAMSENATDALLDVSGQSFGNARQVFEDLVSNDPPTPAMFSHFIELHIEQGAVLDSKSLQVAAVSDIVGMRSLEVRLTGLSNHAGTTPMHLRRDAFLGLAAIACKLESELAKLATPGTVWTIGRVSVDPNAPSIVPGQVTFTVQWRDASEERLAAMQRAISETIEGVCSQRDMTVDLRSLLPILPTEMDDVMVEAIAAACEKAAPGRWRRMVSGALHDAVNVASCMPTCMVFVPSIGGISHNPEEDTAEEDLIAGLKTLAYATTLIGAATK